VDDDAGSGQWMTYDELARARGINRRAAVRLSQRHRLRRQPGNDGLARIWVPNDVATPPQRLTRRQASHTNGSGTAVSDAHVDAGDTQALAAATARAEQAEANRRADVAIALADRTLAQLAEAEKRADTARDQLQAVRVQLTTAEAEAKAANDRAWASSEQQSAAEQRADAERARADRMEAQAVHLLDAEARTRRELETVRKRVAEAEAHQDRLRAEVDSVRVELAAVRRTEDERKGRGRWARLRSAWRGE
jgi:hypothetical protein